MVPPEKSPSSEEASAPTASTTSSFTFFNISHPAQVKTAQHRTDVRSHVTKVQHQRKKRRIAIPNDRLDTKTGTPPVQQARKRRALRPLATSLPLAKSSPESDEDTDRTSSTEPASITTTTAAEQANHSPTLSKVISAAHDVPGTAIGKLKRSPLRSLDSNLEQLPPARRDEASTYPAPKPCAGNTVAVIGQHQRHAARQAAVDSLAPDPNRLDLGRHDPFNCYNVDWHPWYDGLLHYMMTVFAPRGWPALKITTAQGLAWENFMTRHAMQEPALFYVRLLFASGELVRKGIVPYARACWLQSQAINAINEALTSSASPARSTSDGMILAVGRIALHEFLYGDRAAANNIHRPAQRRMISLRGGMGALEFPPLVKKLMRWADNVMALQSGTERLLLEEEEEERERAAEDKKEENDGDGDDSAKGSYDDQQSVTVLEAWEPKTGQALRKKITSNSTAATKLDCG